MSQQTTTNKVAVRCNVNQSENAPEFAIALCKSVLSAARVRWSDAHVSEYFEGAAYDILVSLDVNLPHESAAIYQLMWGDQQSWMDGTAASSEQMSFRKPDTPLNSFMAERMVKGIFASIDVDF